MTKGDKSRWNWQWPETGRDEKKLAEIVKTIPSPYEEVIRPICYPGTNLSKGLLGRAKGLLSKQINSIGSHTSGEILEDGMWEFRKGEGGFETVQHIEAQVVWMIASMIGGTPATIDGYFCGGGTEANLQGLWMGREWLKQCPDPLNKGIVVLASTLHHYSIVKATELLDIGHPQKITCTQCGRPHLFMPDSTGAGLNLVGMNEKGEISISDLEKVFRQKYNEGFRRFLIVPTVGTCLMGSIDPIREIGEFTRSMRNTGSYFYIHVDASFAGFTVPFVKPDLPIGFTVPEVMSMTLDGDKMGRLPYPAGIFLCRKKLMNLVAQKVNYVRGNEDNTVSGSRTCISPVLAWYLYQSEGIQGQREYVQQCLDGRDKLLELITRRLPWIKLLPYSPWVNFAPMEISIDMQKGEIPEEIWETGGILAPYHLRSDYFPSRPIDPYSCPIIVYKICIMPHNLKEGLLEKFIDDIDQADQEWKKKH